MKYRLDSVLDSMQKTYHDLISGDSRFYIEVDIGKAADRLGYPEVKEKYKHVFAVIPIKVPLEGMKVRIDGRTFVNYVQFESGIAVPGYVAADSQLAARQYVPKDSMICNFA